jgi:hypothetical protein
MMENFADGSWLSAGSGLEPAESCGLFPPQSGWVRGFNYSGSGWYFLPAGDRGQDTRAVYVIMTDLRGWFVSAVINRAIGGSYVSCFEDLFAALEARGWKGRNAPAAQ